MNIREAAAVLRPLLEGVDPGTGEVLPEQHILRQADVRKALMVTLQVMEAMTINPHTPVTRSRRLTASRPWTQHDLADLRQLYQSGVSVEEIARMTHRRVRGVWRQLNRMADEGPGQDEHACLPDTPGACFPTRPWTDEDSCRLRRLHEEGLSIHAIAARLNRPAASLRARLFYMGLTRDAPALFPPDTPLPSSAVPPAPSPDKIAAIISPSRPWTAEDDAYLRQAWAEGVTISGMCTSLGRRDRLVRCRLIYLGVTDHSLLGMPSMPPELAHQGLPWYPEDIRSLYHMFRQGRTTEQMAAALLRSADVVRNRLEMLGLTTE